MQSGVEKSKHRILEAISFIYLFALSSLYIQLPGLYGDNGILPIKTLPFQHPRDAVDFIEDPNLLRLNSLFQLDVFSMLEFCVCVGCGLAFLATLSNAFRNSVFFLVLWLIYYSCVKVGQEFLWFQWDIMLLEVGFLAVILARMPLFSKNSASDRLVIWLVRWLLFRLMFSAGVVKLTSNCPAWWGLSALHWHYQSQCIPTPIAWYFHHLPGWFHTLCVSATLIIEILIPLLFFVPLRTVRLFSFYGQVFLQLLIILTGNYNFFNMLTIVLCYSLLRDEDFHSGRKTKTSWLASALSWLLIGSTLAAGAYLFKFRFAPDFTIKSSIGFSKEQFNWFLTNAIKYTISIGLTLYLVEFLISVTYALRAKKGQRKLTQLVGVFFVGIIGLTLLMSSFVPLASLDDRSHKQLPVSVHHLHKQLRPYHVTNSYGLFRRMTGVGGRPEVILSAASSESGPWTEYQFRFKPGQISRNPPFIIPHQPRLDWQMWFAALGTADRHPWFYNLVYRLLQQEPDVLALLDTSSLPRNPKYIRAQAYTYHYTSPNDGSKNWWRRVLKQEYLPATTLNSPSLRAAVEHAGLTRKMRTPPLELNALSSWLIRLRSAIGQPPDLSPLVIVCLLVVVTKAALRQASLKASGRLTTD